MLVRRYVRQPVRRQQPVDQRLQPVGLADDHLRVFDQLRPVELALEQLRRAADAAQRILDLVREAADQLAVGLLLLCSRSSRAIFSCWSMWRNSSSSVARRSSTGDTVQVRCSLRLAADAELELLLGVGRRRSAPPCRSRQRGPRHRRRARAGVWPTSLLPRQLEQVLGGRIRVGDAPRRRRAAAPRSPAARVRDAPAASPAADDGKERSFTAETLARGCASRGVNRRIRSA